MTFFFFLSLPSPLIITLILAVSIVGSIVLYTYVVRWGDGKRKESINLAKILFGTNLLG